MKEKVKKLVEYIMTKEYGEIIYHQEIMGQIGERQKTSHYFSIITGAKKILLESGRMIESVYKSGYQVVYPAEYKTHAINQVSDANKRIRKGLNIMEKAPLDDMEQADREAHNRIYDQMKITNAIINGNVVTLRTLDNPRKNQFRQLTEGKTT